MNEILVASSVHFQELELKNLIVFLSNVFDQSNSCLVARCSWWIAILAMQTYSHGPQELSTCLQTVLGGPQVECYSFLLVGLVQ